MQKRVCVSECECSRLHFWQILISPTSDTSEFRVGFLRYGGLFSVSVFVVILSNRFIIYFIIIRQNLKQNLDKKFLLIHMDGLPSNDFKKPSWRRRDNPDRLCCFLGSTFVNLFIIFQFIKSYIL